MTTQLYDVVIFEKSTRKIESFIGKDMRSFDGTGSGRNTAEFRMETRQDRINDSYDCDMVPAGIYKQGDVIP